MRLIQIPFSHNCIKVRKVLELKGLPCETEDIRPMDRARVRKISGQGLVPVLEDRGRVLWDSTAIALYLEERYPKRPLLPADSGPRAECLVLEDWADAAFMALSRRLAYWKTTSTPGALEDLFFPQARGIRRWLLGQVGRRAVRKRFRISAASNRRDRTEVQRLSSLAMERIHGMDYLVGGEISLADISLASMSAPLWVAHDLLEDPAVRSLLDWGRRILGDDLVSCYLPRPHPGDRARC